MTDLARAQAALREAERLVRSACVPRFADDARRQIALDMSETDRRLGNLRKVLGEDVAELEHVSAPMQRVLEGFGS